MPVAIYLRVSTEEQRERQSIQTQREFAERYCALHQLTIYEVYSDDGVSGTIALENRPAGRRLLQAASEKRFDQIIVFKLDRLGRDTRHILNAVDQLEKSGVRVRSGTEEFDTATATGRLMLTMLSGFAAHERESIRERSMAGTNRLAEAGAWLGGVVPYGYLKEGEGRHGRIVVNEQLIAGFEISEADVVRTIFRMSNESQSCQKIADYLNRSGIPVCSAETAHGVAAGKRMNRIARVWRPGHVRNMIVSPTYKGQHHFGKRSMNRNRRVIVREVPAIVTEEVWQKAQQVLRSNQLMAKRSNYQPYLLRGLIKCGLCGLTYSGVRMKPPQRDHYYRCNGTQCYRGLYGNSGKKCPSKSLNGDYVERLVWADIESFLRSPGEILEQLRERLTAQDGDRARRQKELEDLTARLDQKSAERERVLGLFRRGRIDDATLDRQLDLINTEAFALHAEIEKATRSLSTGDRTAQLQSAEGLLKALRMRLDQPVSPELKRRIVEVLVEKIQANTVERWGVRQSEVIITYRFSQPEEPAALVIPRQHRVERRSAPPEELRSLGDHLLRRRLMLKLLQREVAEQLGVGEPTVYNWENGRSKPGVSYMPAIIRFLGYDPQPSSEKWAARLVQGRTALGLTQSEAAKRVGVDACTLARWERGEREPEGRFAARARAFLEAVEGVSNRDARIA